MTQQPDQQPADTADVDLDAWLDDVDLPVTDVVIYGKASLVNEHDRLTREIQQLRLTDARVTEEDRGVDHGSRITELEQQRADVVTRMHSSSRTFRLRGLTQDQYADLTEALRDPKTGQIDGEQRLQAAIAAMTGLTTEQVARLRKTIPFSEWVKLTEAATTLLVGGVNLPFS